MATLGLLKCAQAECPDFNLLTTQKGCGPECSKVIGPPLTEAELETVREALWKYEAENNIPQPTCFQQEAYRHLAAGAPLRIGDIMSLHGAVLGALRPDTFMLAQKWQSLALCFLGQGDGCIVN